VIIRFLANRNWGANDIAAEFEKDSGQDADGLRTVQSWLVELRRARKDLYDFHRSEQLSLDQIDHQILVALEKWPFESCHSLGGQRASDPKTMYNHLL
jgi:hypothetical protein